MRKIVLISLALILALGSLGVGYAMWSDTVTISGPVTTGTLNLSFDEVEPSYCVEWYYDESGNLQPGEFMGKNVGNATATRLFPEQDSVTDKTGYETLQIVVNNAYPGYFVATHFLLHNIGSVPLDVTSYDISGQKQKPDGTLIYNLLWGPVGSGYWQNVYEDADASGNITAGDPWVLRFRISNHLPVQIDPCYTEKREVDIHFLQPLQQLKKYVFTVVINSEQWSH